MGVLCPFTSSTAPHAAPLRRCARWLSRASRAAVRTAAPQRRRGLVRRRSYVVARAEAYGPRRRRGRRFPSGRCIPPAAAAACVGPRRLTVSRLRADASSGLTDRCGPKASETRDADLPASCSNARAGRRHQVNDLAAIQHARGRLSGDLIVESVTVAEGQRHVVYIRRPGVSGAAWMAVERSKARLTASLGILRAHVPARATAAACLEDARRVASTGEVPPSGPTAEVPPGCRRSAWP